MSSDSLDLVDKAIQGTEVGVSLLSSNAVTKYLLYRKYLSPDSLWMNNKSDYWELEQVVLHWAWSNHHQHMGSTGFNITRVDQIFEDEMYKLYDGRKALVLERTLKNVRSRWGQYAVQSVMGNIYRKGFALALFGKDHVRNMEDKKEKLGKEANQSEVLAIEKWIMANYFEVTNLFVNDAGLAMGELVHEFNSWSVNRFTFPVIYVLEPSILYSIIFLLLIGGINIFTGVNNSAVVNFYLVGLVVFGVIPFLNRFRLLVWSSVRARFKRFLQSFVSSF